MPLPPEPWTDTPALSERITFALTRLAAVVRRGLWQQAATAGLNATQVEVLELLFARQDGVPLNWMASQLGVSAASASDSVASLVTRGLVQKGRSEQDGRAVVIALTSAGRETALGLAGALDFVKDAAARLPAQTQQELFDGLLGLIGSLQTHERFPSVRACVSCQFFAAHAHGKVHHCRLLDVALPQHLLRLDCPEHQQADPHTVNRQWREVIGL